MLWEFCAEALVRKYCACVWYSSAFLMFLLCVLYTFPFGLSDLLASVLWFLVKVDCLRYVHTIIFANFSFFQRLFHIEMDVNRNSLRTDSQKMKNGNSLESKISNYKLKHFQVLAFFRPFALLLLSTLHLCSIPTYMRAHAWFLHRRGVLGVHVLRR